MLIQPAPAAVIELTSDSQQATKPRVALFVTCMVDTIYPEIGMATADLLERHGVEVIFPEGQTCCGQPAFNAGYRGDARKMARHFLDVFWPLFDQERVDAIVAPSGSCVAMVRHAYRILLAHRDDEPYLMRAKRVGQSTFELTEYLVDVMGVEKIEARCQQKLTYHPCCHLLRELGVDEQPRRLLAGLQDAEIVELPQREECCGFGGLFSVKNADISTAMARRKAAALRACGADLVAVNDVSCMTQLNGVLKRDGHHCRAVHIAELLWDGKPTERS